MSDAEVARVVEFDCVGCGLTQVRFARFWRRGAHREGRSG